MNQNYKCRKRGGGGGGGGVEEWRSEREGKEMGWDVGIKKENKMKTHVYTLHLNIGNIILLFKLFNSLYTLLIHTLMLHFILGIHSAQ